MNCHKYLNLIDDLVEGELDEQTAEQISLHLFACQNCTAQFERLEREKEIYSHFLFEIEPPNDLLNKFQTRLETEKQKTIFAAQSPFGIFDLISRAFAFLRLNPVLITATALILFVLGFVLINSMREQQSPKHNQSLRTSAESPQLILPKIVKIDAEPTPVETKKDEPLSLKNKEDRPNPKPVLIKQPVVKKSEVKQKVSPELIKQNEEEKLQIKQIQVLEAESAKQMEKVELLLRSFRNARYVEGSEIYDVTYETQQARRLLQDNIVLRQRAEVYGSSFTAEMLSKVEPYLLDIANLSINPTSEQVLDIKDRVRNQNIIASLQVF